jgi:hypothetical protein
LHFEVVFDEGVDDRVDVGIGREAGAPVVVPQSPYFL